LKAGLPDERPVTNCLKYGTGLWLRSDVPFSLFFCKVTVFCYLAPCGLLKCVYVSEETVSILVIEAVISLKRV